MDHMTAMSADDRHKAICDSLSAAAQRIGAEMAEREAALTVELADAKRVLAAHEQMLVDERDDTT